MQQFKITVIDDSKATQKKFVEIFPQNVIIQSIVISPFFDENVKNAILAFKPNLIILDLLLEEDIESGFRVLGKLKNNEDKELVKILVVVVSKFIGKAFPFNKKRALELGAVVALPKIPFPKVEVFLKLLESANSKS